MLIEKLIHMNIIAIFYSKRGWIMANTRKENLQSPRSMSTNLIHSMMLGGTVTVATAPFINFFNRLSVASSRYNLTGKTLFKAIYSGELNAPPAPKVPSYWNFNAGLRPHLAKELTRNLVFKSQGLAVYLPWLQSRFSPGMAAQIYAISMSVAEMAINPIDTWRVVRQSGDALIFSRLYKGAVVNGVRQYGIWLTFGYNNILFDPVMKKNGVDPDSPLGIAIKAYPQATINVVSVYWLERIKNELQFGTLPKDSTPLDAARAIYRNYGCAGFFRGLLIKTPGAAIQHTAALAVTVWGKHRHAQTENAKSSLPQFKKS